ncbi:hypothetical protein [Lachnospira multipara]|uniref:Uncharacterized protein n=1 Tax=Lachnospira multipara TaxID=28051 RepID=A0A1H5VQA0_9FIRM|nr:hypothetical protein [Lachnospira multipara]SEF89404.1 hypothetical protein SAMN05216537_11227 [Lachnospira multipara]
MYQEMLSDGLYDSAEEYAILRTLAEAEFEEECAQEEARKEYEKEYKKKSD